MNQLDILKEIKNDPTNWSLWHQYGTLTAQNQDWKTCISAYLAALRLNPQPDILQQCVAAYQNYVNSLTKDFSFRFLQLPKKTLVVDMYGLMNMDVTEFEQQVKSLLAKKYQVIFLHFTFVRNLTGLGPSTIKKIIKWSGEKNIDIAAVAVHDQLRTTFNLKKIEVQEYSDLLQAFQNK
ncbi:hypothetical protein [Candidatus Uabimicrobium amorphum]|uniref:Uncharacterized protein n=1 Tax=Uabimicrobium amorphum TaxID=2596890 RepID=A0A5S9F6I2_UABAM|nr:hypothetical protein [Candidatus Uabimicrobium amorphum]BBM87722.1 hypothetical protein UABAM_06137 [Candidatus Uabimicrobium amorphum]